MSVTKLAQDIKVYIKANVQALHLIVGGQQAEAIHMLRELTQELEATNKENKKWFLAIWDAARGFGQNNLMNPVQAVQAIADPNRNDPVDSKANAIIVLLNFHYELGSNPAVVSAFNRAVAESAFISKGTTRLVVIMTPTESNFNPDCLPYVKQVEMPYPTADELQLTVNKVREEIQAGGDSSAVDTTADFNYQLLTSLGGLTGSEAHQALSEAFIRSRGLSSPALRYIEETKGQLLKKSQTLTYTSRDKIAKLEDLAGYEEFEDWLNYRLIAYTAKAEEFQIEQPKGCALVGVPGSGKSVCGSVIGQKLGIALVRLDVGAIFNSLVGESEARMRDALRKVDAMNGCVLLIDEADKAFGNAHESSGDSGVTRRIFGNLLTWLAEKKSKTFVVMTMNRVDGMPPELLRSGRFDEVFFVDTPADLERRKICEIHMRKRNIQFDHFTESNWNKVVSVTDGFVGAEIEQGVRNVVFKAMAISEENRWRFDPELLVTELKGIVPLTRRNPEGIAQIRKFGKEHALPVSRRRAESAQVKTRSLSAEIGDPNLVR